MSDKKETPKKESVAVSSTTEATNAAEKEVEDVEQNEMDVEDATIGATKGKFYTNDKALYFLEENESGYGFYQKGMAEPFAMLIDSDGSDNFIYNSLTKQGMAYFADNGDLVVEIFDRQAGKSVKTTYKLQH